MGEKFHFNAEHAFHVAALAAQLFDQLQREHGLSPRNRLLLRVAAILHEVGSFVSNRAHHKHSYYLISNSDVYGLRRDELQTVALVAPLSPARPARRRARRVHGAAPRAPHGRQQAGGHPPRRRLARTAATPSRSATSSSSARATTSSSYVRGVPDLSLERRALAVKADLFEEVYGMKVRLEEAQQA